VNLPAGDRDRILLKHRLCTRSLPLLNLPIKAEVVAIISTAAAAAAAAEGEEVEAAGEGFVLFEWKSLESKQIPSTSTNFLRKPALRKGEN
jgi:hypothetical protein